MNEENRDVRQREDHPQRLPGCRGQGRRRLDRALTEDGTFTDESIPYTYRGPDELGLTVEVYAKAFPDMHRELHKFYLAGDVVIVQLSLQGTHLGPLELPSGTVPPTGKRMDAPCCDVFELVGGKIKRFDCYPEGTVIAKQLGLA